ncbi:MAG TPA: glycine cleavage system aminomethyltransferase GcvT [Candidatus Omnitrophota bacterium]|jgi:aminomethyltransferase|nr:glycine cleavage system aminomethyltransferase GcvT [Candidatus Omnitrophota bacterium]HSA30899.1 glycine cleavage system aminomethyltransferase GcvT [Candidatus Omnitrophota bacterium]
MPLKQTPIYDDHLRLQAKMVPFGGWDMPVQYESIIAEYGAVRQDVAVFDICHMGEFILEGDAGAIGLDRIVTQSLSDLPVQSCRYGAMLNEKGGVIDDLIVFRLRPERWMLVVNGATIEKDKDHILKHLKTPGCFEDISDRTGKLDVQGPRSREFLKPLLAGIEKLSYYTFDEFSLLGERVTVSRTGYTGELGYEIYCPSDKVVGFWKKLLDLGAQPAGLGARDVLRIEMGYSLYGHELDDGRSPLEAGLNPFICWEKDFIGKSALLKEKEAGVKLKIICFVSDSRRSPREGQDLFDANGLCIGKVSSGTFSPALSRGIGLAFVKRGSVGAGDRVSFGQDQIRTPAQVVSRPIYKSGSLKS